jgi:hypothetical protein
MLPKKITMKPNQESVRLSDSQHRNEPAGLKPPQIRSQIPSQSSPPQSPLSLDTHAGLNTQAPTPGTPPKQTRALLKAEDTRLLSSRSAARPLSSKLLKRSDASSGDAKGKTPSEELRQEWLKTDFDHLLGKRLDAESGLQPAEGNTVDASPRKRPKLMHGRPEAEKAKEQKQHGMHIGAGKQDVFLGFNPISRKSHSFNKENLLADPGFPFMRNLEMAVLQYQFSSCSSKSSVARITPAQWRSPSAKSSLASKTAHAGSAQASRGPDQPRVNGEIPHGSGHSLKRKWDESNT